MDKRFSLADKILLTIKDLADVSYDGLPKTHPMHESLVGHDKHSIVCTVNRLKKAGFIEEIKVDGIVIYKLLPKGKVKIFKSYINHKPRWDGKWRMVIFDIPENKKKVRELFRARLKDLGFHRMQNSVWLCPYDVQGVIKLITDVYDLNDNVHLVIADQISGEKELIKNFGIEL